MPPLTAIVQDISPSGMGLLVKQPVPSDVAVQVDIHGHIADGVVRHCRPQGNGFWIGIALASLPEIVCTSDPVSLLTGEPEPPAA